MMKKNLRKVLDAVFSAVVTLQKEGYKIGDAEEGKWVTLSNGAAVQLGEGGELKKGMGGQHKGENIKEAAKAMAAETSTKTAAGGSATSAHSAARHGSEAKTPSGVDKTTLPMRDKVAISNTGKFNSKAAAQRSAEGQKYRTNVMQGEGGQFWVPATNREESILKRLGYKEAAENPSKQNESGSNLQKAEAAASAKAVAAKAAKTASASHGYSPESLASSLGVSPTQAKKQLKQAAEALEASGKSGEAAMTAQLKEQNKGKEHLIKSDKDKDKDISSIMSKIKF